MESLWVKLLESLVKVVFERILKSLTAASIARFAWRAVKTLPTVLGYTLLTILTLPCGGWALPILLVMEHRDNRRALKGVRSDGYVPAYLPTDFSPKYLRIDRAPRYSPCGEILSANGDVGYPWTTYDCYRIDRRRRCYIPEPCISLA